MNPLDQLKQYTTVVADTVNFRELAQFTPRDAVTNPALVLKAVQQAEYAPLLAETVAASKGKALDSIVDGVLVRFGLELLKLVPGRVGTAVDARLSFDTAATIARAHRIVELYERAGIGRERLLIEVACTWEGIQAAKALEHEGIGCNLTLLFAFCQAVACGEAGVHLISPVVDDDPGVRLVAQIYTYYKHFGIDTEVMGTSLRDLGQVHALAGCDRLALGPELLAQLQAGDAPLARALDPALAKQAPVAAATYNEASFRWALNDDAMASGRLSEGIRAFAAHAIKLDKMIEATK